MLQRNIRTFANTYGYYTFCNTFCDITELVAFAGTIFDWLVYPVYIPWDYGYSWHVWRFFLSHYKWFKGVGGVRWPYDFISKYDSVQKMRKNAFRISRKYSFFAILWLFLWFRHFIKKHREKKAPGGNFLPILVISVQL